MIIKHKVIIENNEEVLCVYLDTNLEGFSSELGDNNEGRQKNLRQQIGDYLKSKGIQFNGSVVKVLVGVFIVATLTFTPGVIKTASASTINQFHVVETGDSLYTIARDYGISIDELKSENQLTTDTIYPGQTLSVGAVNTISSKQVYVVNLNDSLFKIANATNLSINQLKDYNNLTTDTIQPGQTLLLTPGAEIGNYNVKSGDSLWSIAKSYGMSVDDLKLINNVSNDIYPYQNLKVIQAISPKTYTVEQGDSLWSIANNNNMTVAQLQSMNNLTTSTIIPGQQLYINPGTTAPTTEAPAPIYSDTTISVRRANGVVQSIDLEEYVAGVVASELGQAFNQEAYKAQALAARTYAVKRNNEGKTISDTDIHQVYKDTNQLKQLWGSDFDRYYGEITTAVNATSGQVISYEGELIDALYFSTSNGRTDSPEYIWGGDLPYLKSVDSHWDTNSPYFYRTSTFTNSEFATRLGISSSNLYANVLSRTDNGSVNSINISGRTLSGNYVKSRLGLRSTDFDINFANGKVTIAQRGWGHSVGLSQYGAYFMGEEGYSYDQIIKHYYQGVDIVNM